MGHSAVAPAAQPLIANSTFATIIIHDSADAFSETGKWVLPGSDGHVALQLPEHLVGQSAALEKAWGGDPAQVRDLLCPVQNYADLATAVRESQKRRVGYVPRPKGPQTSGFYFWVDLATGAIGFWFTNAASADLEGRHGDYIRRAYANCVKDMQDGRDPGDSIRTLGQLHGILDGL
jgi:hypothetical protein